jgi:predicted RNA binding protein YcfA (HicA-like mRNA interferase family)
MIEPATDDMSKHQKTLERICSTPTPSDICWQEMQSALESLGYVMLANTGSRRKFYHRDKNDLIICHAPHSSHTVDKGCVNDVAEHLKANGFVRT